MAPVSSRSLQSLPSIQSLVTRLTGDGTTLQHVQYLMKTAAPAISQTSGLPSLVLLRRNSDATTTIDLPLIFFQWRLFFPRFESRARFLSLGLHVREMGLDLRPYLAVEVGTGRARDPQARGPQPILTARTGPRAKISARGPHYISK